jgi:hypothetical protein
MKYRTRTFYSETQKAIMWDRWRQGETLHNIALLFDRHRNSIRGILAQTGGIRPAQRVRASRCCRYLNAKRYPVESSPVARCVPLQLPWAVRHQLSVEKSGATGAVEATGHAWRTKPPGTRLAVPSAVNLLRTAYWQGSCLRSSRHCGHRNRSQAG